MTVCFFSTQYLPTVGGVERYTFNLAQQLRAAGHQVLVVTAQKPGLPSTETDSYGTRVIRLPSFLFMNGRFPWPKPGALKPVWREKIDFAVIQTRFYPLSVAAALGCKSRGIPAIVIDHSTGHMPMGSPLLNLAGGMYEHLAAALIKPSVKGFYGVSLAVNQWLNHFDIQAKGTLHNAVDPGQLATQASGKNWRSALGLSPNAPLAVFVGRIIPEKGVAPLVEAFVSCGVDQAALAVAGDGPQLEQLKQHPQPGVHFLGSVPYPDVLALLQQADVYCLPTTYAEGFPTTFLEAAACGCPIITTVTGGSSELMPTPEHGIQLPDADPSRWREALAFALTHPDWRAKAAALTKGNLEGHFTWKAVSTELLDIMKDFASKGD